MVYREEFERIRQLMIQQRDALSEELLALPQGRLLVEERNGRKYYSERFASKSKGRKETRKGITKDPDRVLALVRKQYVKAALKNLDSDLDALDTFIDQYKCSDPDSVMEQFIQKNPELAAGISYKQQQLSEWASEYVPKTEYYKESLRLYALDGTKMRSDGELFVASRLEHYGIPYRYEAKLPIPDLGYIPDFTIMRPSDRKIFYWEHFGKIDDHQYVLDNYVKVGKYMDYGIVPWDNLIMTYNYKKGGVNIRLIEAMINAWLL